MKAIPHLSAGRAALLALASVAVVTLFGMWRYATLLGGEEERTDRGLRGTAEFMANWTDLLITERSRDARLLAAGLADAHTPEQWRAQLRHFVSEDGNTAAWLRLVSGVIVSSAGAGRPDSVTLAALESVACTGRDTLLPHFASNPLRIEVLLLKPVGDVPVALHGCARAVALRANLTPALLPFLKSQARLSVTGTSFIAARTGASNADAMVIIATRYGSTEVRRFADWRLTPHLRAALEGRDTAFATVDAEGTMVRAASTSFRGASWGVVRQIEASELVNRVRPRAIAEAGLAMFGLLTLAVMVLAHQRALRIEQLKGDLTGVQLDVLRAQLQPHFLFNVLNSVSELIHRDPEAAEAMIVRLSRLLRFSLATRMEHEIPLGEEIDGLRAYADIEQARFADRLHVEYDIPASVQNVLVPPLLLQPIVENAIKHGLGQSSGDGRIVVRAREEGDMLWLSVSDTGAGLSASTAAPGFGVGLGNTKRRLSRLYGTSYRMHIRDRAEGGAHVDLELPLRRDRAAAEVRPELPVTWRLN